MIKSSNPGSVHPPVGPYSHLAEGTGVARWLVLTGQVGRTVDGFVPSNPLEQIEVSLENLRCNLEFGGMEKRDLIKLTWYLVGEIDPNLRRQVIGGWLNGHEPCSTLVYVAGLAAPEYKVEVDGWACCRLSRSTDD